MPKKRSAIYKEDYSRLISHYKRKRRAVQELHGKRGLAYTTAVAHINKKLRYYRIAIKRIDVTNARLHDINLKIQHYYDFSMYTSVGRWDRKFKIRFTVRKMFCKYAIEQGITGTRVSDYLGYSKRTTATRYRLELNKLIQTDDILKQQWHKFKKFMERELRQKTA